MNEPIKLSIAATSKRVDIANVVALTFFNNVQLPRRSRLDVAMGWRDSELGGTGPALLVGKKQYDFGFGETNFGSRLCLSNSCHLRGFSFGRRLQLCCLCHPRYEWSL